MKVFNTFFKVAKKYKLSILLYFGISAFMTFLVASQYGKNKEEVKYGNVSYQILVTDYDHSVLSEALVEFLKKQHTVEEKDYAPDILKDLLYYQELSAAVTIPEGFGEKHLEQDAVLVKSLSDDGQAAGTFINMQINSYLGSVVRFEHSGFSLEDAIKYSEESNEIGNYVSLKGNEKTSSNTHSKFYSLFLFLPYAVMSIILSSVLPVILLFNGKDIKERTMISAIRPVTRNLALIAGAAVISLLVFAGMLLFTSLFLPDDVFTGKWLLAGFNLLVFTIVTTMMLMLIASFSFAGVLKAKDVITNIVGLGFCFLGGIFVPLSILGDGVKAVGRFLPTYWYAVGIEQIDGGAAFGEVAGDYLMQLLFGLVCLALGLAISRATMNVRER